MRWVLCLLLLRPLFFDLCVLFFFFSLLVFDFSLIDQQIRCIHLFTCVDIQIINCKHALHGSPSGSDECKDGNHWHLFITTFRFASVWHFFRGFFVSIILLAICWNDKYIRWVSACVCVEWCAADDDNYYASIANDALRWDLFALMTRKETMIRQLSDDSIDCVAASCCGWLQLQDSLFSTIRELFINNYVINWPGSLLPFPSPFHSNA